MMMAARRVLFSRGVYHGRIAASQLTVPRLASQLIASSSPARFLSNNTTGGGGGGDDKDQDGNVDDPFGVKFEDGAEHGKFGPTIPPRYRRDAMTGKFTGETESELTEKDKSLINMDLLQEQVRYIFVRVRVNLLVQCRIC